MTTSPPVGANHESFDAFADAMFHLSSLEPATAYHARIDSTTFGAISHSVDFVFFTPPGKSAVSAPVQGSKASVAYDCETAKTCSGKLNLFSIPAPKKALDLAGAAKAVKSVLIGTATFKIRPHHKGQIRVRLNRTGVSLLKHRHKLKVQALYKTLRHQTETPLTLKR